MSTTPPRATPMPDGRAPDGWAPDGWAPDGWALEQSALGGGSRLAVRVRAPIGFAVVLHDVVFGPALLGLAPQDPARERLPGGFAARLAEAGIAAVAPRAGAGWWLDAPAEQPGPTPEGMVLAEAEALAGGSPCALVGFGAGGHGALRIAYKHPRRFPVVAASRPAIDCHLLLRDGSPEDAGLAALFAAYRGDPERGRQDSATLHIHPLNWPRFQRFDCPPLDPWWEGADRLRMKLASIGVPFEADLESSMIDHHATVAWVADRLAAIARGA